MYNIDEENSEILFEVVGDKLILKLKKGSGTETGASSVYVIKKGEPTLPTDENVFSSLRALAEIDDKALSKLKPDTAEKLIKFLEGIEALNVRTDDVKSNEYSAGALGSGMRLWMQDGQSFGEIDNLMVRMETVFNKLTIAEQKSVGGQILVTLADIECLRVEELTDVYRCYFDNQDGTIPNKFAVNDQARCQTFTGKKQKYYWRLVVAVGPDYIDLSKTDCDGVSVPEQRDSIIQLGNRTDHSRQNAILFSAFGVDAPSLKQYSGINSYSLIGKEKTVISPSRNNFTGEFSVKTGDSSVRVPADRGVWMYGMSCNYYDRVSHNGALWLCIIAEGTSTTEEPSAYSQAWQKQVSEGGTGYRLEKLASPGYDFYRDNQAYNHTLAVRVYFNEEDITETVNIMRFKWSRISENTEGDPTWNQLHANSGYEINITNQDLAGDTHFILQFYDVENDKILTTKF